LNWNHFPPAGYHSDILPSLSLHDSNKWKNFLFLCKIIHPNKKKKFFGWEMERSGALLTYVGWRKKILDESICIYKVCWCPGEDWFGSVNGILFEKSETITMIHLYIFQRWFLW
jgi:hypothetical protein